MADWRKLEKAELKAQADALQGEYDAFKAQGLKLDMTRGKPCPEQLDLAQEMLSLVGPDDCRAADGTDCRNYGGVDGLPEAKALFAEVLGVSPAEILIGGNASLALMHDTVLRALLCGVPGGTGPWRGTGPVRFLCPCPGYDRHFAICEHFGIEMIPVAMGPEGPDMAAVEEQVARDASIKGIWCVPKYANPTGVTYTDAVVDRLAGMPAAAPDFRIFWDNAYAVHHLGTDGEPLKNILAACKAAGNPDRVYLFGSTSKISFAGAGLGFMGASEANLADARSHIAIQTIGPDKLNQLRHVRFFKDMDGIRAHMDRHAAVIAPKFRIVLDALDRHLAETGVACWSRPSGGYFVSLDVLDNCAGEIVRLAGEAGVKLTKAGATFPYGKDPRDRNIRIAPTLPSVDEIAKAMDLLCICVRLIAAKTLLAET